MTQSFIQSPTMRPHTAAATVETAGRGPTPPQGFPFICAILQVAAHSLMSTTVTHSKTLRLGLVPGSGPDNALLASPVSTLQAEVSLTQDLGTCHALFGMEAGSGVSAHPARHLQL